MILLSNEVVVFLFLELVLLLLQTLAFLSAIPILKKWDFGATTSEQYGLEKRAYLVVLIILTTVGFKILLLPFFSYMIDALAAIVPGAMCGAGVIGANDYGYALLIIKVVILTLSGTWLMVNKQDLDATNYPYFKAKFRFFIVIYFLILVETVLDFLYLSNISTLSPVQCCSNIYGAAGGSGGLPFGLDTLSLLIIFYLLFVMTVVLALSRNGLLNLLANVAFLYFSYFAVVYFFGTYVYELPTHKCPFCMLQKEYFFMGYAIWGTLFLGAFFGSASFPLRVILGKDLSFTFRYNIVFNTLFVVLCSVYVGIYYLRNGVFL
jgi:hypothetical protein